jgi:hypothetical protein
MRFLPERVTLLGIGTSTIEIRAARSFNYSIRFQQHSLRDCQSDLFGCFEVNYQLELRRLLYT